MNYLKENFKGQYIDGVWRAGNQGGILKDTDPYTGECLAELIQADVSDVNEAYTAAARAQVSWSQTLPSTKRDVLIKAAALLQEHHDEIIDCLITESGSTRIKAEVEWKATYDTMLEAASLPFRVAGHILPLDEAGKESRVYRQALGVITVISPWNFPLHLSNRSVAPALALGNAVVLKPAPDTPITGGLLLAKIYEAAGLPAGLLNVVVGDVKEIGETLVLHPLSNCISFTGSTTVGRQIASLVMQKASTLKRLALELGGNSPCVVFADADLDLAAHACAIGRYFHQGQICMSTNRLIVEAPVYEEFLERFVEQVQQLKLGNPKEADTMMGPIINTKQLASLQKHIAGASGTRCLLKGEAVGQLLPAHVFADVDNQSPLAQSELFGPIAPIIKADNAAHALQLANDTPYGLSGAVFTRDVECGLKFALQIKAGMTHINDSTVSDTPTGPFGGEKNSGLGRFGGLWMIEEFTRTHWITLRHSLSLQRQIA